MFYASMGPQPVGRGEGIRYSPLTISPGASMGPQPVGRGEEGKEGDHERNVIRFNGATASRPWRGVHLSG